MGLRYTDLAHLKKSISPDVEIDYGDRGAPKTEARKKIEEAEKAIYDSLEDKFYRRWLELNGPELVREFRFHEERKWRFDFALVSAKVAIEIQGGLYEAQSGHRSFDGVQRDYEKFNTATLQGWTVFQITSKMIKDDALLKDLVDFCHELCNS